MVIYWWRAQISIHHAFYWQRRLITHQCRSAVAPWKCAPVTRQTFLVQITPDEYRGPEVSVNSNSANLSKSCQATEARRGCLDKYSAGSRARGWANVCGGICRWWAASIQTDLVSALDMDVWRGGREFLSSPQVFHIYSLIHNPNPALLSLKQCAASFPDRAVHFYEWMISFPYFEPLVYEHATCSWVLPLKRVFFLETDNFLTQTLYKQRWTEPSWTFSDAILLF